MTAKPQVATESKTFRLQHVASAPQVYLLVFTVLIVVATLPARALTPAILIGPDLQPQRVTLHTLADGMIHFFDEARRMRVERLDQFVQLRDLGIAHDYSGAGEPADVAKSAAQTSVGADQAVLELTDGQRLVGRFVGGEEDGQAVWFDHPGLGQVSVSLEGIASLTLRGELMSAHVPSADRVHLGNGDVLEGFVVGVTGDGVELQNSQTAGTITLSLDRVRAVHLANPLTGEPSASRGVWLRDGSRLHVDDLNVGGFTVTMHAALAADEQLTRLPVQQVQRFDTALRRLSLRDLVDLTLVWRTPAHVFGVPIDTGVTDDGTVMHAPSALRYELPNGAARFAATVALHAPADAAPQAQQWADLDVVLLIDGHERARVHLDAASPAGRINVDAGGLELTIRIESADNGPVMDQVRISDAAILLKRE